jgi:hypothetical protein
MKEHPYLRAYMAGIALPTAFMLVALTAFCVARFIAQVPIPIERSIVFPMALIPNIWGAWNILYAALRQKRRWDIGLHGAILPPILGPMGFAAAKVLGILQAVPHGFAYFNAVHVPIARIALVLPIGIAVYYLAWKYVVGFFNRLVEVGE